jgi:hypothetical protein
MTADRQCCGRELRRAPIKRRRTENLRPAPERDRSGWRSGGFRGDRGENSSATKKGLVWRHR